MSYQVGRGPGIGPAQLTCPNTDTDHSDQSVPVLFAPLFLEGPILPGRAISVVRRESLSATLSPVVHSIPEDDWVSAEAEALLDATPGLREDLRAAMDELHAGTLQTVDAATARARIEARIKSRGSS